MCKVISEALGGWNPDTKAITHVADALIKAGYAKTAEPCFEGTAAYVAPRVVQPPVE